VPDGEVIVRLENVTRRYGNVAAADRIDLEVLRGEMFGLIGPDGAGKTTTLRVALGLLPPHEGTVRTCGLDPRLKRKALSGQVGYLPQRFSLYGDLSVDENIAFHAEIRGVREWRKRRDELLELVRMTPFRGRPADRLSGGMKQKLALACTLIHTPTLLVLDEPTTGVDPVSRRDFWRLLEGLQREGMTVFLSTPYLEEAERCGRVALMDRGRLLVTDEPGAMRKKEPGVIVELLARPKRRALEVLRGVDGVAEAESFGERLHVFLPAVSPLDGDFAAMRLKAALLCRGGIEVEAASPVEPSLEDVFISRIRSKEPAPSPADER
jgi:ABC-2 type transport system ATP-binding protein